MVQPYSFEDPLPAVKIVREWDVDTLLVFLSIVLGDDDEKAAFATARITGEAFLLSDDASFAQIKGFRLGPRKSLALLVREIISFVDVFETLSGNSCKPLTLYIELAKKVESVS